LPEAHAANTLHNRGFSVFANGFDVVSSGKTGGSTRSWASAEQETTMSSAPTGGYQPPIDQPVADVSGTGPTSDTGASTTDLAKDQASQVGQTAKDSGKQVASAAADEAKNVVGEAQRQAKDLGREVSNQVQEQAATQKDKAAGTLRSLGEELRSMAQQSGQSGPATDLAHQAAGKVTDLAQWLEQRDPGSLVDEVRSLARRKPGTFLLGAAAAGVVAGRLTRGAVQASKSDGDAADSAAPVTRDQYQYETSGQMR
jgi:vacuolar-type H+-ATPase subunit H